MDQLKLVTLELEVVNNHPIIHLFGRDENGVFHKTDDSLEPHFYINSEDMGIAELLGNKNITRIEPTSREHIFGNRIVNVITHVPTDVSEIRDKFGQRGHQSDVHFTTLYEIEKIKELEAVKFRTLYGDTEWDSVAGQVDPREPTVPCISISVFDNFTKKMFVFTWHSDFKQVKIMDKPYARVRVYPSEELMFKAFAKFVHDMDFDILTGQDFIRFDITGIIRRMEILKLEDSIKLLSRMGRTWISKDGTPVIKGRVILDLLALYKKFRGVSGQPKLEGGYKLTNIVKQEGIEKEPDTHYSPNTGKFWRNDLEKLWSENCNHAMWCYFLDQKHHIIEFFDEIRRICHCEWSDVFEENKYLDCYFLTRAFDENLVLPTKPPRGEDRAAYKGALVIEAPIGILEWVAVLDIRSMYPTIIQNFNMSPETIIECREGADNTFSVGNDVCFKKTPIGFIPRVYRKLFEHRQEKKNKLAECEIGSENYELYSRQVFAVKTIMNAIYGLMGFSRCRVGDVRVAKSITFMENKIITRAKELVKGEVVYGDTDSLFLRLDATNQEEAVQIGKKLLDDLHASFVGTEIEGFTFELKTISKKMIWVEARTKEEGAKKRYASRTIWKDGQFIDKFEVTGFDMKRSNTAPNARGLQKKLLTAAVYDTPKEESEKLVQEAFLLVKSGRLSVRDIAIPQAIQKGLDEYKVSNPWVDGCRYSVRYLNMQFKPGDTVHLVYVKPVNIHPRTTRVCLPDGENLPKGFVVDYDMMVEKGLRSKVERVLQAMGLSWGRIALGETSLAEYF